MLFRPRWFCRLKGSLLQVASSSATLALELSLASNFLSPSLYGLIAFCNKLLDFGCLGGVDAAVIRLDMLVEADVVVECKQAFLVSELGVGVLGVVVMCVMYGSHPMGKGSKVLWGVMGRWGENSVCIE